MEERGYSTAFVFVAYAGVTKSPQLVVKSRTPVDIPYGILLSLLISCLLYVFITIVMVAAVSPESYMNSAGEAREDPVYIFAEEIGGYTVGVISAVFAVTVVTSMALAGIMATSRFPFAMARDNLLPRALENVHTKYQTPHWAIYGTGIAMALSITFLPVHDIAKLASGFKIMIFIVINSCVIILRRASPTLVVSARMEITNVSIHPNLWHRKWYFPVVCHGIDGSVGRTRLLFVRTNHLLFVWEVSCPPNVNSMANGSYRIHQCNPNGT